MNGTDEPKEKEARTILRAAEFRSMLPRISILCVSAILLITYVPSCISSKPFWEGRIVEDAILEYKEYESANLRKGISYKTVVKKIGPGKYSGKTREGNNRLFGWHSNQSNGGGATLIFNSKGRLVDWYWAMP